MTIQRNVKCSDHNCPHEKAFEFSDWLREALPDDGLVISDIDFVLENYKTKKCMFIELKTYKKEPYECQNILFKNINNWIKFGIRGWKWKGFHLIQFEKSFFDDGYCMFDRKFVTEEELIKKLTI